MTRHSAVRLGIVTLAAAALAACTDRPGLLEPTGGPSFSTTSSGSSLKALKRSATVSSSTSVTQVIGRAGGTIQVGDWSVAFPRRALGSDVAITVTVPAGNYHWIKFEPHGLSFDKAVKVVLSGASSSGTLYSAYIGQDFDPKGTPVLELLSASGGSGSSISFSISHFSGYVIATGEGDGTTSSLDLATMTMTDTSSSGYIVVTGDE